MVGESEADAIAAFLNLSVEEFLDGYTALAPDRQGLTLIEKPDGSCIFLTEGDECGCRINPVKPRQCEGFPLRWNFPGWEKECRGAAEALRRERKNGKS